MKGLLIELWTLKAILNEALERKEESYRESLYHLKEYIFHQEYNVGRNMDIKGRSNEVSDRNEELIIRNWRKGHPFYKTAKNLAQFCFSILCKVEFVSDETGYLAEEMSKQSGRSS